MFSMQKQINKPVTDSQPYFTDVWTADVPFARSWHGVGRALYGTRAFNEIIQYYYPKFNSILLLKPFSLSLYLVKRRLVLLYNVVYFCYWKQQF